MTVFRIIFQLMLVMPAVLLWSGEAPYRALSLLFGAGVVSGMCFGVYLSPSARAKWDTSNRLAIVLSLLWVVEYPEWVALGFLGWMTVHRSWTANTPSGLRSGVMIALLNLVLVSGQQIHNALWLAPSVAVVMVICATIVLIGAPLRSHQGRVGVLGLGLGATAAFFAWWCVDIVDAPMQHATGFAREVTLGDLGPLHDDATELARIHESSSLDSLYLGGVALDRFVDQRWVSTAPMEKVTSIDTPHPETREITLQPLTGGVLLGEFPIVGISRLSSVQHDANGTWWHEASSEVTYRVHTATSGNELSDLERARWLVIPADLDPRIAQLAQGWAGDGPQSVRADRLVSQVRSNHRYTKVPQAAMMRQSLSGFLFETKTGHCEYFATALAVMLRVAGIPSRLIVGVRGGVVVNSDVVYRQLDAHAWVEAYLDGLGWVILEPTPAVVDDNVQPVLAGSRVPSLLSMLWIWIVGIALPILGLICLVWWRRERSDPIMRAHRASRRLIEKRGWCVPGHLNPLAAAQWLQAHVGQVADPLVELVMLMYRTRYGGEEITPVMATHAKQLSTKLARLPNFSR